MSQTIIRNLPYTNLGIEMHRRRKGGRGRFPIQPKIGRKPKAEKMTPNPSGTEEPIYIDFLNVYNNSIDVVYDDYYWLTPRYEEWYGTRVENTEYDYEVVQYYQEVFTVYDPNQASDYTHEIGMDYSLATDFVNPVIYKVIGLNAMLEETDLTADSEYTITPWFDTNEVQIESTYNDLDSFDSIIVMIEYEGGPISHSTAIKLSPNFETTYLGGDDEETFYDYLTIYFEFSSGTGNSLFYEDASSITTDFSSFYSIDYSGHSPENIL